jgi:hypothetical protein
MSLNLSAAVKQIMYKKLKGGSLLKLFITSESFAEIRNISIFKILFFDYYKETTKISYGICDLSFFGGLDKPIQAGNWRVKKHPAYV